jgi:hypothetical protein
MTWGGLNLALTAYRNALELRLGAIRGRASDGARADAVHGSNSQHQEDRDGTVDAFDQDVNVLGSSKSTGTAAELRIIEAEKLDFERDPYGRGKLWIHNREIANRDRDNWAERDYTGKSPHTEHIHLESDEAHEDDGRTWPMPNVDRVLRELGVGNPQNDDQGESDGMQDFWKGMYEAASAASPDPVSESNERQILARVSRHVVGPEVALALDVAGQREQAGRIEALLTRIATALEAQAKR